MTKLTCIRHGKTELNAQSIIIGHKDISISEEGKKDAEFIGNLLKNENFDIIITSDLKRTKETTAIISKIINNKKIIETDKLRELNYGKLTGIKKSILRENDPLYKNDLNYKHQGGESFNELYERVIQYIKNLENKYDNILIITHSGCIRAIYSFLKNEEFSKNMKLETTNRLILKGTINNNKSKYERLVIY